MKNIEDSGGLFRDVSDVENFKITLGARLRDVLRYNYGISHIQAMLEDVITRQSLQTKTDLISSVQVAFGETIGDQISPETISFLVKNALEEVLTGNFGEDGANTGLSINEMRDFTRDLPDDTGGSRGHSRRHRELRAEEELSF